MTPTNEILNAVPFNAEFSAAIGGYPKGAFVEFENCFYISEIDDNVDQPCASENWSNASDI